MSDSFNQPFLLWYCNIYDFPMEDDSWKTFLSQFSSEDQDKALYYIFKDDQKRALGSILLQRSMIKTYFSISDNEYQILRSVENKPYAKLLKKSIGLWNYNVSHHGSYVAIVSSPNYLVGIDIVDVCSRSGVTDSFIDFSRMFESQFHPMELRTMHYEDEENRKYSAFYVNWALKEAFVKAIGIGLGYNLLDIRFYIVYDTFILSDTMTTVKETCIKGSATIFVKNIVRNDWRFQFWNIDDRHVIAVAIGPLSVSNAISVVETSSNHSKFVDLSTILEHKSIPSLLE